MGSVTGVVSKQITLSQGLELSKVCMCNLSGMMVWLQYKWVAVEPASELLENMMISGV